MSLIPPPPDLKPTIIQMQTSNDNTSPQQSPLITAENNNSNKPEEELPTLKKTNRRRRSSSSLISQTEIEKRRREHKTAHSIIEKKRRIRMNREFEALKFLIPACRNSLLTSNNSNSSTSSSNKDNGEGMYKLTILQATVDYVKYLHNVINIQQNAIKQDHDWDFEDLSFASIDIDTEKYRDVDQDFDFNRLFNDFSKTHHTTRISSEPTINIHKKNIRNSSIGLKPTNSLSSSPKLPSLPSPIITPELYPSAAADSSTTQFTHSFNSKPFKNGFQSNQFKLSIFDQSSQESIPPNEPSTILTSTTSTAPKLSMINEFPNVDENDDSNSASHALLSLKNDSSGMTSIKSILN